MRKNSVTGGNYRYFFDCINVGADQCVCPKNRVNYFDYDECPDSLLQNNTPRLSSADTPPKDSVGVW